jgi:hypothetical protein
VQIRPVDRSTGKRFQGVYDRANDGGGWPGVSAHVSHPRARVLTPRSRPWRHVTDKVAFCQSATGGALVEQPHALTCTRPVHLSGVRCRLCGCLARTATTTRSTARPKEPCLSLLSHHGGLTAATRWGCRRAAVQRGVRRAALPRVRADPRPLVHAGHPRCHRGRAEHRRELGAYTQPCVFTDPPPSNPFRPALFLRDLCARIPEPPQVAPARRPSLSGRRLGAADSAAFVRSAAGGGACGARRGRRAEPGSNRLRGATAHGARSM